MKKSYPAKQKAKAIDLAVVDSNLQMTQAYYDALKNLLITKKIITHDEINNNEMSFLLGRNLITKD